MEAEIAKSLNNNSDKEKLTNLISDYFLDSQTEPDEEESDDELCSCSTLDLDKHENFEFEFEDVLTRPRPSSSASGPRPSPDTTAYEPCADTSVETEYSRVFNFRYSV